MSARNNNMQLELVWLLQRGSFTAPEMVAKIGGCRGSVYWALRQLEAYDLARRCPQAPSGPGFGRRGKPAVVWEWVQHERIQRAEAPLQPAGQPEGPRRRVLLKPAMLLEAIGENPGISAPALAETLRCPRKSIHAILSRLRDAGLIENRGSQRGGSKPGAVGRGTGPRNVSAWYRIERQAT